MYDDSIDRVGWYDGTGTLKAQFVFAPGVHVPYLMVKNNVTYRVISDAMGSPRFIVDTTGAIAERLDYDEFGNVVLDTAPGFLPFGFTGGLYDADTLLVRLGARDYSPTTGRWTAKDPLKFAGQDTNLYSYVANDPANDNDPNGLYGKKCCRYYEKRCAQFPNDGYYCGLAQTVCKLIHNRDPDPNRSDCVRKCLQDLDKERNTCSTIWQLVKDHDYCFFYCVASPYFDPPAGGADGNNDTDNSASCQ